MGEEGGWKRRRRRLSNFDLEVGGGESVVDVQEALWLEDNGELSLHSSSPSLHKEGLEVMQDEESELTIIDSGTGCYLSREKSDFVSIPSVPDVCLKTAGGCKRNAGTRARVVRNSLGIRIGVFVPSLPVKRLCGSNPLLQAGWKIVLQAGAGNSYLQFVEDKTWLGLYGTSKCPDIPHVALQFKYFADHPRSDGYWFDEEEQPEVICSLAEAAVTGRFSGSLKENMVRHWRSGHQWRPTSGRPFFCDACDTVIAPPAQKVSRAERQAESLPLFKFHADHWSCPFEGLRGEKLALCFADEAVSFAVTKPSVSTASAARSWSEVVLDTRRKYSAFVGEKLCGRIRTDNDGVFCNKPESNTEWKKVNRELDVDTEKSEPYVPSKNGVGEARVRGVAQRVMAMAYGVDKRLWPHAARFQDLLHNCRRRRHYPRCPQFNGLSPREAASISAARLRKDPAQAIAERLQLPDDPLNSRWRRWGCFGFVRVRPKPLAGRARALPAVMLGYDFESHSYIWGCWVSDRRAKEGYRFEDGVRSNAAKIYEEILVGMGISLEHRLMLGMAQTCMSHPRERKVPAGLNGLDVNPDLARDRRG